MRVFELSSGFPRFFRSARRGAFPRAAVAWAPAQYYYNPGTEVFGAFGPWSMFLVGAYLGAR